MIGRWGCAAAIAVLTALALPSAGAAQTVKVSLDAGAAVGNYTDTSAGLDLLPEPAYGVRVEVWPTESLAGYLGFTRASFGCEEGFCIDRDVSLTSQGLVAGGHWSPGLPWVRAGLALQGLTVSAEGAQQDEFDPRLGFELGAGIDVGVGRQVRLRPGLLYLRHQASTSLGEGRVAVVALELGLTVAIRQ